MSAAGAPLSRQQSVQLPPWLSGQGQQVQLQLPQIVLNGFSHSHTASEMTSLLSFGERPLVMLIMAPVVAKSFALSLLSMVEHYERSTGTAVGTIEELSEKISAFESTETS